jgi:hypothetical protein
MKPSLLSALLLAFLAPGAAAVTMTMTNAIGGVSDGTNFTVGTAGTQPQPGNNWPANEPPSAAIDNLVATKYLNFFQLNTGLIVTPDVSSAPLAVDTLTFFTANDAIGRDPTSYILYGSTVALSTSAPGTTYSIGSLVEIGSGILSFPDTRLTGPTSEVNFINETAYASYLLVFPTVKSLIYDGTNNSMQVADVVFDGHTPIPEPGSALLLALTGAAVLRRRR